MAYIDTEGRALRYHRRLQFITSDDLLRVNSLPTSRYEQPAHFALLRLLPRRYA